jgi:hypothetical protein
MNCWLNSSNLGQKSIQWVKLSMLLLSPQQGQHIGQSSNISLLFLKTPHQIFTFFVIYEAKLFWSNNSMRKSIFLNFLATIIDKIFNPILMSEIPQ